MDEMAKQKNASHTRAFAMEEIVLAFEHKLKFLISQ